jgi:hypothetical protein
MVLLQHGRSESVVAEIQGSHDQNRPELKMEGMNRGGWKDEMSSHVACWDCTFYYRKSVGSATASSLHCLGEKAGYKTMDIFADKTARKLTTAPHNKMP